MAGRVWSVWDENAVNRLPKEAGVEFIRNGCSGESIHFLQCKFVSHVTTSVSLSLVHTSVCCLRRPT